MIDYMLQVANHFPAQAHSPGYCGKGITASPENQTWNRIIGGFFVILRSKKELREGWKSVLITLDRLYNKHEVKDAVVGIAVPNIVINFQRTLN